MGTSEWDYCSPKCMRDMSDCPHADAVAKKILKRARVGRQKYGTNCARLDLSTVQWLAHLQEEMMDATVYLERIIRDMEAELLTLEQVQAIYRDADNHTPQ
jgi:hypothetical protein